MFCPKCGKENIDGAILCSSCGEKLRTTDVLVGSARDWNVAKIAVTVLSGFSLLGFFLPWFQIRYLELFTDRTGYSAFEMLFGIRKLLSYARDYVGSDTVRVIDLLGIDLYVILIGLVICAVIFLAGLIQIILQDKADVFCGGAIFSAPFTLTAILMLNSSELVYLTSWPWVFLVLCMIDVCAYVIFVRKRS